MDNTKNNVLEYLRNFGLAVYFLVLFVERLVALIVPFADSQYAFYNSDRFVEWYSHILTAASLILTVALMHKQFFYLFTALVPSNKGNRLKVDYNRTCLGAGTLLLGGMVHTNFTLAPVQFVAYGFMILSMISVTVLNFKLSGEGARLIISLIYAICFAMAIPVVYDVTVAASGGFIALECVVSALLVFSFTVMLSEFYQSGGKTRFSAPLIVFTVVCDFALFFWRMNEAVNIFLIVFPILAAIFWIIGRVKYGGKI